MKFSIRIAVGIIIGLLFLASLVSVYFAVTDNNIVPLTLVAVANIVAVILLTFLITRGIVRPLQEIQKIIRQVGQGNFSAHIQTKGAKEMEELAAAFNDMIARVGKVQKEVQKMNVELEGRVQKRTQQLQELTASLEDKVQQRTHELEEKVGALELFEKLVIRRELKMVELKKEIENLQPHKEETETKGSRNKDNKKKKTL
tara:strand:+ start:2010 stop:2612 length:603 start_codon:yes stop_codon:yes gene_type:complete